MAILGRVERKDVWVLRIKNEPIFEELGPANSLALIIMIRFSDRWR